MRLRIALAVSLLLGAACSGGQAGGESHFLQACTADAECGAGASCVCGTCSATCTDDLACEEAFGPSKCVAPSDDAFFGTCPDHLAPPAGMCLPTCDGNAACAAYGADFVCEDGVCTKEEEEPFVGGDWGQTSGPVGIRAGSLFASADGSLFVGAPGGLLRSTDGGHTWATSHTGEAASLAEGEGVMLGVLDGSLYESRDGGGTWASARGMGLPGDVLSLHAVGGASFFARATSKDGGQVVIVRTADGGDTWEETAPLPDERKLGAFFAAADVLLATDSGDGTLFRSTDGGAKWADVGDETGAGWSSHFAEHDGSIFALEAGTSTIFRSADRGASWTPTALAAFDPVTTVPNLFAGGGQIFAAMNGRLHRFDDDVQLWVSADAGIEGAAPDAFAGGEAAAFVAAHEGIFRFGASGERWAPIDLELIGTAILAIEADAGALYAASGSDAVHVSTDGGESWVRRGDGLPAGARVVNLGRAGTRLFAATERLGLYVSDDGGESWRAAHAGWPTVPREGGSRIASAFAADGDTIWAGTWDRTLASGVSGRSGGGVLRSTDGGSSWSAASEGLPPRETIDGVKVYDAITELVRFDGRLVLGTASTGVFVSDDGESWRAAEGLPAGDAVTAMVQVGNELVATALDAKGNSFVYRSASGEFWLADADSFLVGEVVALGESGGVLFAAVRSADGGDEGVWYLSRGEAWLRLGAPLDIVPGPLAFQGDSIFLGSSHDGVWRIDLQPDAGE